MTPEKISLYPLYTIYIEHLMITAALKSGLFILTCGALEGGREVARGHVFEGEVEVTYFEICEVRQNFPKFCEVNPNTRSRSLG